MSIVPPPASTAQALGMLESAMGYLSAADATALATEEQTRCLMALERVTAMGTAARASILAAFTAGQGYSADADYSSRAWLIHKTSITRGAAAGHTAWARRAAAHPQVVAALAGGEMSESYGRTICQWTDRLPEDCRPAADAILITAARAGMDLRDLAGLAAEMYERSLPDTGKDRDETFEDRGVRLDATFQGAGVLTGDLSPECAAVGAVLEALSAPAGAEDTRTHAQRYHDGLHEAMRRLLAAGLLPERAGQPVKAWVHVSLADLLVLDGSSALMEEWTAQVRAQWAAHRAAASEGGGDGGAWLGGDAAEAIVCDASVTPVVTGDVNPTFLVPPSDCDSSLGVDAGPEPRRDHHRVEQGQDQDPPQPRPARPGRVTLRQGRSAAPDEHRPQISGHGVIWCCSFLSGETTGHARVSGCRMLAVIRCGGSDAIQACPGLLFVMTRDRVPEPGRNSVYRPDAPD